MLKKVLGVNIAVKDLDNAVRHFKEVLGVEPRIAKPEDFAFPGLTGASFALEGTLINVITSDDPNTPVFRFLESRGEGVFLVSLMSTDLEEDIKSLVDKGVRMFLDQPLSFSEGRVAFVHPKSMYGVNFELLQPNVPEDWD